MLCEGLLLQLYHSFQWMQCSSVCVWHEMHILYRPQEEFKCYALPVQKYMYI